MMSHTHLAPAASAAGFWPAGLGRWERDPSPAAAAEEAGAPRTDPESDTPPRWTTDQHRAARQDNPH